MIGYIAAAAVLALAIVFTVKLTAIYRTSRRLKREREAEHAEYVRAKLRRLRTESTPRHAIPNRREGNDAS